MLCSIGSLLLFTVHTPFVLRISGRLETCFSGMNVNNVYTAGNRCINAGMPWLSKCLSLFLWGDLTGFHFPQPLLPRVSATIEFKSLWVISTLQMSSCLPMAPHHWSPSNPSCPGVRDLRLCDKPSFTEVCEQWVTLLFIGPLSFLLLLYQLTPLPQSSGNTQTCT